MKRKETALGGSVGESVVSERSINKYRSMKRCSNRSMVCSEDTKTSDSRVIEYKVWTPFFFRYAANLEEDEVESRGAKVLEDGEDPPQGGEEELTIVDGLA
jgi:hypothetical protein